MNSNVSVVGPQSRNAAFSDGVAGTPNMVASGLAESSAVFNSKVPGTFTPHSVLQSITPSGDGMSAADHARVLPGGYTLPTPNGMSSSDYNAISRLRMVDNAARY